jgi:hypothetical protein
VEFVERLLFICADMPVGVGLLVPLLPPQLKAIDNFNRVKGHDELWWLCIGFAEKGNLDLIVWLWSLKEKP